MAGVCLSWKQCDNYVECLARQHFSLLSATQSLLGGDDCGE